MFSKNVSHAAGICENYGQTWVFNFVGKKRSGRRVSTREMEEEVINIVTFMALFLFQSIGDILRRPRKENETHTV